MDNVELIEFVNEGLDLIDVVLGLVVGAVCVGEVELLVGLKTELTDVPWLILILVVDMLGVLLSSCEENSFAELERYVTSVPWIVFVVVK